MATFIELEISKETTPYLFEPDPTRLNKCKPYNLLVPQSETTLLELVRTRNWEQAWARVKSLYPEYAYYAPALYINDQGRVTLGAYYPKVQRLNPKRAVLHTL